MAVAVGLTATTVAPRASQFIVSNTGSTGAIPSTVCVSTVTPWSVTLIDFSAAPEPLFVKNSSNAAFEPEWISVVGGLSIWSTNCCSLLLSFHDAWNVPLISNPYLNDAVALWEPIAYNRFAFCENVAFNDCTSATVANDDPLYHFNEPCANV